MNTLYGIPYSPWSEKARWALVAAKVPYREVTYLPMVGEPLLRAKLGQWTGRLSVPVLFTADGPRRDSLEIARWASSHGVAAPPIGAAAPARQIFQARPIFPADAVGDIERWNRASEDALAAGRARTALRVSGDPAALLENLPPPLRRLGPVSRALGRAGVSYLERKYHFGRESDEALTAQVRAVMLELRAGLAGREHLLGDGLTYADITMAVALQVVRPPRHIRLGRLSLGHWTNEALCAEFSDLLAWRDTLIARYRELPAG